MRAYVINLKNRTDRWDSVTKQIDKLGLPIVRVDAISKHDLQLMDAKFVAPGVAATWKSHQLAMATFLESSDEYAVIMEDDFLLTKSWDFKFLNQVFELRPDFFQFGYLVTSHIDRLDLFTANSFDLLLKWLRNMCAVSRGINRKFGSRLLIQEQIGVSSNFIPNDIRAGGQAYLVSRKFAEASKCMNTPAFTSADGVFMSLGDVRSFRMYRARKSLIVQTNSPTSVEQRYI